MTSAAVMHPQEDGMQQDINSPLPEEMEGNDGDGRPTLLVTTVDIGEGRAGRIELRLGDDPVDVASAFCARHGLPETIVLPLAQHLEENLAENAAAAAAAAGESDGQHPQYAESEDEEEAEDEAATPIVQQVEASTYGEASLGSRANYDALPQQYDIHQVETSFRSVGSLGTRPMTVGSQMDADQAPAAAQQQRRPATASATPSYRPVAIHSARGAEYFNRPPPSSRSVADSDGSGGGLHYRSANTGGTSGGLPAHNRLYADHFRKQRRLEEERRMRDLETQLKMEQVHIAPVSNKMAGNRNAGSYRNYGERLYVEGRLEAMRREQDAQRLKEDEARTELEQYTFQPAISKMAQQIKHGDGSGGSVEAGQRLYGRAHGTGKRQVGAGGMTTAERMQAIRREQDEAEVAECSFRPQINSKSARMVQQRQQILKESGLAGYEQLYNDSARLRNKLQALAAQPPEDATFHPQVNTSSVVLKKLMEGREGGEGNTDVAVRLLERGRRYQEKLAAAQHQAEVAPCDATTGQLLFRPKTYRAPAYERNPEGAPIGEYLYSIKAEWDEKAARVLHAKEQRTQQNAASTFVNDRSERLVDRLKRERFRAIFDYLRHGHPAPVLNLLETVQDETFMDTIDPEVRADVEFAGRLLSKGIQRRQAAERLHDCATSAPSGAMSGASLGPDTTRGSASFLTANTAGAAAVSSYGQSTIGEVDAGGFVTLMEEVIARTKGLTRQYLLPMPSGRQKFEEPSFRPCIDPRSQALAARLRPDSLPTYELLYKTAEEQANKKEGQRRVAEAAKLKECLFHPVMMTQQAGQEGRAIKLAAELTQSKRANEGADAHGSGKPAKQAAKQAAATAKTTVPSTAAASPAPIAAAAAVAGTHIASVPSGEQLHFDALERQINEALVRLSMSEEQVAASLRQAEEEAPAPEQHVPTGLQVGQSVDVNGYRLDWRTICSSPSPDGMLSVPEMGDTPGDSSMAGFNPLDDDDASAAASCAATTGATVAWEADSQEVVAHVMPASSSAAMASALEAGASGSAGRTTDGELSGLDLHALASTDLSYDVLAVPAAVGAAAEGSEQGEGDTQ